jgi:hypothetical protein
MTSPFVLLTGLMLVLGLVQAGLSLVASFRRRRLLRGWIPAQATVTGNMHGTDGPASKGMHRFAPTYEFQDAHGQRWLGQADTYGPDQEIIGTIIPVMYNPANPAESTRPVRFISKGRLATSLLVAGFGAAAMFGTQLR